MMEQSAFALLAEFLVCLISNMDPKHTSLKKRKREHQNEKAINRPIIDIFVRLRFVGGW
jgi:hypothetical protein